MTDAVLGSRSPEVRRLRELLRDPAARAEDGRFVLEGPRLVAEALDRGVALDVVYVGPGTRRAFAALVNRLVGAAVPVRVLREGVLEKVGSTRTPQPVLGVVAIPSPVTVVELRYGAVVMAAGVNDPGNLGTIIRSAEAGGAVGVVASGGVDPWNPKVVRASAGAVLGIPIVVVDDAVGALGELADRGRRIVAADVAASTDYDRVDLRGALVLVVGGEAHGLPSEVAAVADAVVRIPMAGPTESLNVGVAASVLLFEAARQARS